MKKIVGLLVLVSILFGSIGVVQAADNTSQIIGDGNTVVFVDVPKSHWAANEIQYFASQNIIAGIGNNMFAPDDGVTREEFCKMLALTFHAPLLNPAEPTFSDVGKDKWSYSYVEVCKDFLTGYNNPFGGKPAFHPTEYATREDIAVALVRMMGLTDKDAYNPNYAKQRFSDASNISPNLLPYISIATERGLIKGYLDGTFGPLRGITRAETVVLLNRATKQAVTNIDADLELSANVVSNADFASKVTIYIETEEGAIVTVNGQKINISRNMFGMYEGAFYYEFEEEGTKTFEVVAKKLGKTKSIKVNAKYEISAPTLNITQCPSISKTNTATIYGNVKDVNDNYPVVTINGKSTYVDYYGNWSMEVNLVEGANSFTIIASNNLGKSTTIEKVIILGVDAPTLNITQCPSTSNTKTATIYGNVKDVNDNYPVVTINGKSTYVDYYGNWSMEVNLVEGDNNFTIIASNNLGKSTTIEKVITFGVSAPTLNITQCPSTSNTKTSIISGNVKDVNNNYPVVTINGKSTYVDYYGNWSMEVNLVEGDNNFTIIASNNLGKSTTIEKVITFGVSAPTLNITQCPSTSNMKTATIYGNVKDVNDNYPVVTINGESTYVDYYGNWSMEVNLVEGDNNFTIIASNNLGKSTTIEKVIIYAPPVTNIE